MAQNFPTLRAIVLDATDARGLAEFYRQLLGYAYRPGHEVDDPAGDDWLVLDDAAGEARLAIQRVDELPASTWPDASIPQQLHLDLTVPTPDDLAEQRDRALALGATILDDRFDSPEEPLYVFADPAGHPFCIFVVPPRT
jgi:hypothetical protein